MPKKIRLQDVLDQARTLFQDRVLERYVMEALYHAHDAVEKTEDPPNELTIHMQFPHLTEEHVPTLARLVADALFRAYCKAAVLSPHFIGPGYLSCKGSVSRATFILELINPAPKEEEPSVGL